jgi:ribonuclease P protein component
VRGSLLSLKWSLNPRRKQYRAAIVVSRKVHKSAVARNRIRRQIYESVRRQSGSLTQPYDLVFTVFSGQIAELNGRELDALIAGQLAKVGKAVSTDDTGQHAIVEPKERQSE